jgi:hypothetical protein
MHHLNKYAWERGHILYKILHTLRLNLFTWGLNFHYGESYCPNTVQDHNFPHKNGKVYFMKYIYFPNALFVILHTLLNPMFIEHSCKSILGKGKSIAQLIITSRPRHLHMCHNKVKIYQVMHNFQWHDLHTKFRFKKWETDAVKTHTLTMWYYNFLIK